MRAMSCARQLRLQLVCGCVLAALLALSINAVRLNRGAASSSESIVSGLVSRASSLLAPDSAAARAQRDRDLRVAASYMKSIGVEDCLHLGNINNILERFEDIQERVTSFKAARDPRHRLQIRKILRQIKERSEVLIVIARELQAEGEVDDGGDDFPTQRDNICNSISEYRVETAFRELVHLFCKYLDAVRKAVNVGKDEEPTAYSVSGLLRAMAMKPDYAQRHISWAIEQVLGEERRWVAKHIAPRPMAAGNASASQEGATIRFRRWALREWETQIWADVEVDTAALPLKELKSAQDALVSTTVEDDLSLSSVCTRIQRLEHCKFGLAQHISRSDPAFRERIREVLHDVQVRMDSLRALAARKLAAGEIDNSGELLPSQRDNICTKLDAFALQEDYREDIRKLCEAFDRLRLVVKVEFERDKTNFEILGRIVSVRRRPGYSETLVASELEHLLAEEWGWLDQQEAVGIA